MKHFRIIPCLLHRNQGLVKGVRFKKHRYIGDPINTVRIFNDKGTDELIYLDIDCSLQKKTPNFQYIQKLANECFMPLCYGGGINHPDHVLEIFGLGVEKIAINSGYAQNNQLIEKAVKQNGSQSILAVIEYRKSLFGNITCTIRCGTTTIKKSPSSLARELEAKGVGELMLSCIDRDGTGTGYDLKTIEEISAAVKIPVIASCGSHNIEDFKKAKEAGASAAAAGSQFVYFGSQKSVLINYPITESMREKYFFDQN